MRRAAAVFGIVILVGCGSRTPLSSDIDTDAGIDEIVPFDCSIACGALQDNHGRPTPVANHDMPGASYRCWTPQICGQGGGIPGFRCCEPSTSCQAGLPAPGACP